MRSTSTRPSRTADRVGPHGLGRRQRARLAGREVEHRAVPCALDLAGQRIDLAVAEREALVAADVLDAEQLRRRSARRSPRRRRAWPGSGTASSSASTRADVVARHVVAPEPCGARPRRRVEPRDRVAQLRGEDRVVEEVLDLGEEALDDQLDRVGGRRRPGTRGTSAARGRRVRPSRRARSARRSRRCRGWAPRRPGRHRTAPGCCSPGASLRACAPWRIRTRPL